MLNYKSKGLHSNAEGTISRLSFFALKLQDIQRPQKLMMSPKRPRETAESTLPDELRCKRSDGKRWRCSQPRLEGKSYCHRHSEKIQRYTQKKKNLNPSRSPELEIGITEHCKSNEYKIREPEIAETIKLPTEIFALQDLRNVLTVEAWREDLTERERSRLRAFLPEGQNNNNDVVESLLSGENFNFGNPAIAWGASVCKEEQCPEVLLQKERDLKQSQSQYFKDMRAYYYAFIASIHELSQLCDSCSMNDARFRKALKLWRKKKLQQTS